MYDDRHVLSQVPGDVNDKPDFATWRLPVGSASDVAELLVGFGNVMQGDIFAT